MTEQLDVQKNDCLAQNDSTDSKKFESVEKMVEYEQIAVAEWKE